VSLTIEPADVVRIAEALDVSPYGLTAGRLLEEVAARAAERSSGSPGSGTERQGSRAARQLAEEEAALGDAWLAHHGLEPLPGDDGRGRVYLRYEPAEGGHDAPYSPGNAGDEEALWRLHAASLGEEAGEGGRSLAAGDEEEALAVAWLTHHGVPEGERL
jgi:hypothetical protein